MNNIVVRVIGLINHLTLPFPEIRLILYALRNPADFGK